MTDKPTVLVLGVGGNVSQGILKALTLSRLPCRIVGACISPLALGLYTVHRAYVSPRADDPAFLDWLITVCRTEHVQAVFSGTEAVLGILANAAEDIRQRTAAVCIVSDPFRLQIGDDKLETCRWLEAQGFNSPRYASSEDEAALAKLAADCGYPLIAKPRRGKSADGVVEIRNPSQLGYISAQPGYIVQEYLGDLNSEYTAGCFCDRDGGVRGTIVMRREVLQGTTHRAEVGEFPEVRAEATRIAAALQPLGPSNIQLRMSHGQPICFEINVRFSGTTPLRARLGFNEVEEALRHFVLGEPARDLPLVTEGIVLRYWNEMYVDLRACAALRQSRQLLEPKQYNLLVEDYGVRP
jgi:carbamoyl-phosphate synthase large subunit